MGARFSFGQRALGKHIGQVGWTKKGKAGMIGGPSKKETEEMGFEARFHLVPNYISCLYVCLFFEGPLSGIKLSSQNAGSEELAQRSVPDVLQCGESTVPGLTLPCNLEHPLAGR